MTEYIQKLLKALGLPVKAYLQYYIGMASDTHSLYIFETQLNKDAYTNDKSVYHNLPLVIHFYSNAQVNPQKKRTFVCSIFHYQYY